MKKGLKNPAAIVAAPIIGDQFSKAGKAAGQRADKINKDTKGGLSILLLLGVAVGIYTVWKLTAPIRAGAGAASDAINTIKDGVLNNPFGTSEAPPPPETSIITDAQAEFKAAQLHDAMIGPGTNWKKIKNALEGLTLDDYQLVAQKFGTKRYLIVGGEPFPAPLRNLNEWLQRELSSAEINELKNMIAGL